MGNNSQEVSNLGAELSSDPQSEYLKLLGDRVREARARRGMTRKILARDSGVSERYLAQLERGQGNISILLLRDIARALDIPLEQLVLQGSEPPIDFTHTVEFLRRLRPEELTQARQLLIEKFAGVDTDTRRNLAQPEVHRCAHTAGTLHRDHRCFRFGQIHARARRITRPTFSSIKQK